MKGVSVVVAELWVIRQGLWLTWTKDFCNVVLEPDAQEAFDLVAHPIRMHPEYNVVLEIRSLMARRWNCFLQHVGERQMNVLIGWKPRGCEL
ncbi:hypothetical protein CsSME_00028388 [Camellia sinensis var. sinensis]